MQSKDLFPLFGWAKARRNPPQVSKTELKVISKNPTQVPSHKSNFQNDQEKSPIKKLKVATAQSRTKFYQDIDAQNRMKRKNIQNPQFLQISTNFLPKSTTPYEIVKNPQKLMKLLKIHKFC